MPELISGIEQKTELTYYEYACQQALYYQKQEQKQVIRKFVYLAVSFLVYVGGIIIYGVWVDDLHLLIEDVVIFGFICILLGLDWGGVRRKASYWEKQALMADRENKMSIKWEMSATLVENNNKD